MVALAAESHGEETVEQFRVLARQVPEDVVVAAMRVLAVANVDPAKAAFVARATGALVHLAQTSSQRALLDAAGARSDLLVLVRALEDPEALLLLAQADPLAEARVRGLLAKRWLLEEEGGVSSAEQFGRLLGGLSRQAIDKRRRQGKLLALEAGKRGFVYPVWQIHDGRTLAGLDRVLAELDDFDPWMQAAFFLNPNSWLSGESPLVQLRTGNVDRVVAAAATYAA